MENVTSKKPKTKKLDDNSKTRILSSAMTLFSHKGFDSVSVREICKSADVNLCMISYHFGGKTELYQAIIDDIAQKQLEFIKSCMNLPENIKALSREEQIKLLYELTDKLVDFMYKNVTNDMLGFMIRVQHMQEIRLNPPIILLMKKLIANIFNLKEESENTTYQALFILSQIGALRLFPTLSLKQYNKTEFSDENIVLIKNNLKTYLNGILKEVNND